MKITKREYTKQMTDLTFRKATLDAMIAKIIDTGWVEKYDKLNGMHDRSYRLEQAIKDLDRTWQRRNWTAGDYASYALIAQNID